MTLRLNGSTSGYTEIDAPAVAGSNTVILPSGNGSANQFLKNGSTAGSLGWSSMVETATGDVAIGKTSASENPTTGSGFGFASTATDPYFSIVNINASGGNACIYLSKRTTGAVVIFYSNNGTTNTQVGSISHNGSSTAYNTSSDYRLKESVAPITGGINRLQQLKPSRFNFIVDPDKTVDGFIAHEVQAVVPEAVTGEKDAVDEDGNPIYQGIDQSKLVPLLTAALQEAVAKIESLEARIAALEVTP